ncbi:MAG: insulinase family protein [Eubacteriales bacterium]
MDKYYVPENVVVSIAGNITFSEAEKICDEFFASQFKRTAPPAPHFEQKNVYTGSLVKVKDIEQAHIGLCMPSYRLGSKMSVGAHTQHRVRRGHEQPPVSEYPRKIRPRVFGVFLRFAV